MYAKVVHPLTFLFDMNTLGRLFQVTSFGESHGSCVGCVLDGLPAGFAVNTERMQAAVNRRKTAQTNHASTRQEDDIIEIVSGLFEGQTTGSPLTILIRNQDARSADYDTLKEVFRPNHADFTYQQKYGYRDHRGGGRSSVRITAPLVAAGDVAWQILQSRFNIYWQGWVSGIGLHALPLDFQPSDEAIAEAMQHPLRVPSHPQRSHMEQEVETCMAQGDTLGGCIRCRVTGIPAGWGEPVFGKLQAQLAHALFNIPSVKGFEYGDGFEAARQRGHVHNDAFFSSGTGIHTRSNHSGGIQGGISNGMPLEYRIAFKPISSIRTSQQTVDQAGQVREIQIEGRHDVCAVPRALPIVEAYTGIVLLDAWYHQLKHEKPIPVHDI